VDVIWSDVLMYIGSMMLGWLIAEVFLAKLVVKGMVQANVGHKVTPLISS
jgi:hypothetical protein